MLIIKSKNLECFPLCERNKLTAKHTNFASANSKNGFISCQIPAKYSWIIFCFTKVFVWLSQCVAKSMNAYTMHQHAAINMMVHLSHLCSNYVLIFKYQEFVAFCATRTIKEKKEFPNNPTFGDTSKNWQIKHQRAAKITNT